MTIKEYCDELPPLKMSELIKRVQRDNLSAPGINGQNLSALDLIICYMESKNKIIIDHSADFQNSLNI